MILDTNHIYTYCALAALVIYVLYLAISYLLKLYKNEFISDIDWLVPPSDFIILPNSLKIAYRQKGQGQDLLLIHGIGANTFCWRLIYSALSEKYRVVCIDLPGFGYSSKSQDLDCRLNPQTENVKLFIDELKLKNPILVGSSMGGTIALWLGLLYPNQFSKIIAIAPAAGVGLIPIVFRKINSVSNYLNWGLNRKTMILILKQVFANKRLITNYSVEGYLKPYLQNKTDSIHGFVSAKNLIQDKRLPHDFKNLKCKPLILASRKDKMVRKKDIKNLLNTLPDYEFHLHRTSGHHIMEEEPGWVLDKMQAYLDNN